ncbi:replication factor A protein 1-like [Primulina huaijiensis]|uniref:replication factor A protein 1-like n=1 Tax=Primulina huaijiensis TaxID=1492673 RepID=UPI003CC6F02B
MRLSVNTFYGISVGTVPNSTILFDPPIQQAGLLKRWLEANKEYIETVVSQKLYDKANQETAQPFDSQIRKISQILSLNEVVKSFWIKARITIKNSGNCVYFLACPGCSKSCGGAYKYEFTCFYCNHEFPSLKPLLRFQAELFDGTGSLYAYVEHKEATMLLCMSGEDLIDAEENDMPFCPDTFNQKLQESKFLFQLRTMWNKTRGKNYVRNTVIACLPATESSSASHSYEDKGSSFKAEGLLEANVVVSESQESSSAMQKDHFEPDIKAQPSSSTGKRKLEDKEALCDSKKHVKQD